MREYFMLTVRPARDKWVVDEFDGRGAWVRYHAAFPMKAHRATEADARAYRRNLRRRRLRQGLKPWKGRRR